MENKEIKTEKEFKRAFIIASIDKYYFYPSKFNLIGRMGAYLSRRLTPKQMKEKLLEEIEDEYNKCSFKIQKR